MCLLGIETLCSQCKHADRAVPTHMYILYIRPKQIPSPPALVTSRTEFCITLHNIIFCLKQLMYVWTTYQGEDRGVSFSLLAFRTEKYKMMITMMYYYYYYY